MSRFVIVFLLFLALLGGVSHYIAHRLYRGFRYFIPKLRYWPILTVFLLLSVVMALGVVGSMLPFPEEVNGLLNVIAYCYMGIFFYLLLFTIAVDLIVMVPRLLRFTFAFGHKVKAVKTIAVLTLTALTCTYGFWNARQIDHVSYEVSLSNAVDISDINIVMISDLHLGAVGSESRLENIVTEINAQEPDLVCIVGDIFDTDFTSIGDPEKAMSTLNKLSSTYGVYACLGNHDAGDTSSQMIDFLNRSNIQLLSDDYAVIDQRLVLVGRLDGSPIGGYENQVRNPMPNLSGKVNRNLPVIVMDHNPENLEEYADEVGLLLCGHTHGGQVLPVNVITDIIFTVDYGHYQKDEDSPHVIVTSGVGYWGMPMRVGTNCEIVTIHCT